MRQILSLVIVAALFICCKNNNADKVVEYLDLMSFSVKKKTVVVLDNASVLWNRKIKELRKIWEERGLFLFYLPPYSPELNPAEILWRVLKCKWFRPVDYTTTDSLSLTPQTVLWLLLATS